MASEPVKQDASFEEVLAGGELSEDKRKRVEELIEEEEGATNRFGGVLATAITAFAVFVSVFHLYAAVAGSPPFTNTPIIATYLLRPLHVGMVLALIYMLFPMAPGLRNRINPLDWICAALSLLVIGYIVYQGPEFGDRAIDPDPLDFAVGLVLIVLLLEATRRSTGWIMPVVVADVHHLRAVRQISAAALDAPRLLGRAPGRPSLHDAGRHLRHDRRCVVEPDHPVHDLRRHSAVLRCRQVLHRLLVRGHGRQAQRRRARGRAVVASCSAGRRAPAWPPPSRSAPWPIRCWRRPATRRTQRAGCSPPAGSAPSSRRRCSARPPS